MSSRSGESRSRNKRKAEADLDARRPKKFDAIKPIRAIDGSQAQRLSNCVEVVGHDPRQCKCYKVLDKELWSRNEFHRVWTHRGDASR